MSNPINIWLEKKQFLEVELAKAFDSSQKFTLHKQIEECNTEITRLQNQQSSNETFEQIVSSYSNAFLRVHINQNELIPFLCVVTGQTVSSIEAKDTISKNMNIILTGPSGCGKSLLARQIAQQSINHFKIPIFIEAKYFDGNIWTLLDQETRLLGISLAKDLLDACRVLQKHILIVIDGYNECPKTERDKLARSLLAMQNDIVGILVTSQENFESLKPLNLEEVCVVEPSIEIKRLIATASMGTEIPSTLDLLLATVKSNLEASLIGKVGQEMANENNLFKLFDAYVRKLLQDSAQDGVRIMTDIAKHFSDRLTFSLSLRDMDRLLGKNSTGILINKLFQTNLLTKHVDKISFSHELFLNAFAAEAIIRYSDNDPDRILAMLALPKHSERKSLIVGAIDDIVLLNKVLEGITDCELIVSCVMGSCGTYARQWGEKQCQVILDLIKKEIHLMRFKINESGHIYIEPESLLKWKEQHQAFIQAFPLLLSQGKYFEEIFNILGVMDEHINIAFKDLRDKAQKKNVPLRSLLFASVYVFGNKTAIAKVCEWLYFNKHMKQPVNVVSLVNKNFTTPNLSNGQLYFLLHCYPYALNIDSISTFLQLLDSYWRYAPYHLRLVLLDLIEVTYWYWEKQEADKKLLIQLLNQLLGGEKNPLLSSSILENLQCLGELDVEGIEHETLVRKQLEIILSDPNDSDNWLAAYNIYSNRFDHLFAESYNNAFLQLPKTQKKILLTMAIRVQQPHIFDMFIPPIIRHLVDFKDSISGKYIKKWAMAPPKNSKSSFEDMRIFVSANVALGQLAYSLASQVDENSADTTNVLQACGEILYWCNRIDIELDERKKHCIGLWSVLMKHELGVSVDALRLCEYHTRSYMFDIKSAILSIDKVFPSKVTEVCRFSLRNPTIQQAHFHVDEQEKSNILKFAINQIGKHGSINDLPLLHTFVDDIYLGKDVIKAVKNLEAKLDL